MLGLSGYMKGMFLGEPLPPPPPPPTCFQRLTQIASEVSPENKKAKYIELLQLFRTTQKEQLIGELVEEPERTERCQEIIKNLMKIDPQLFDVSKKTIKTMQKLARLLRNNDGPGLFRYTFEETSKPCPHYVRISRTVVEKFCKLMLPRDIAEVRSIKHAGIRLRVFANLMNQDQICFDDLNLSLEERQGITPYLTFGNQLLSKKEMKIPDSNKDLALRKEMVTDAALDQKNLLSGVPIEELKAIRECYDHPLMRQVVKDVRAGEWEHLIRLIKRRPGIPIFNILKAAFCQGKLGGKHPSHVGIDNLASAYVFLGPAMSGQTYKIYHFDEVAKHPEIWEDISKRWNIENVPQNQRYFILVKKEQYTHGAQELMKALHRKNSNNVAGGLRYNEDQGWALGSAGLIRSDLLLEGHPPVYGRRLRPFGARFKNLLQGGVEFALLEPTDTHFPDLHGAPVKQSGNLSLAHDGYHALNAAARIWKYLESLIVGQKIYSFMTEKIPSFSPNVKIDANTQVFYGVLTVRPETPGLPTDEDWVRYFLYETITALQDGEASYVAGSSAATVGCTIYKIYDHQLQHFDKVGFGVEPPKRKYLMPLLNRYLNLLGMHFSHDWSFECKEMGNDEEKS